MQVVAAVARSSAASANAASWWHNDPNFPAPGAATAVAEDGPQALLLSELDFEVLVPSHYVDPKTRLLLFMHVVPFPLPGDSVILMPSDATLAQFARRPEYRLEGSADRPDHERSYAGFLTRV